ncbi:hypothetical protein L9F63_008801, partial [Diploptera punctata]
DTEIPTCANFGNDFCGERSKFSLVSSNFSSVRTVHLRKEVKFMFRMDLCRMQWISLIEELFFSLAFNK